MNTPQGKRASRTKIFDDGGQRKMIKEIRNAGIYAIVLGFGIFFLAKGMHLALLIEALVLVIALIVVVVFLTKFTLARKAPIAMADVMGMGEDSELKDYVKDSVHWLEKGEVVEITSFDGLKLRSRVVMNELYPNRHLYVILCHGYTNHRLQDISKQAMKFFDLGYHIYTPYARGHGMSEGKYFGMGVHERFDIKDWVELIVKNDPDAKIALYGISMGGSTVIAAGGEELPDNVKAIIDDCGYTSCWEEFRHELRNEMGVPIFPVLYLCNLFCYKRYKFGFKKNSAIEQVKKIKAPTLFIHGDEDRFVPYEMMNELYEACSAEFKKEVTIFRAKHAESNQVDPGEYWHEISQWLTRFAEK